MFRASAKCAGAPRGAGLLAHITSQGSASWLLLKNPVHAHTSCAPCIAATARHGLPLAVSVPPGLSHLRHGAASLAVVLG
jgi:hypothetical protein